MIQYFTLVFLPFYLYTLTILYLYVYTLSIYYNYNRASAIILYLCLEFLCTVEGARQYAKTLHMLIISTANDLK